ncbi:MULTISPECIES: 2-oxo acid dehydrogenase subunit E2 [Psychrobacter]|uniref:2-oxo acid dehydrogenase subunit E2 n=1 Tax=Psychrobacter TaxID=497 RepID=UPI000C331E2D|nr:MULTISPECIES: 2-oxo acid dehydrogenase subunit E2 [Psychrobacter]PKG35691.1 pyruvate dehydrogenase complex dihydrolipoyllysine-residue acetyltransferase [Psychrobacter sp. Sarcosine-3u-12]
MDIKAPDLGVDSAEVSEIMVEVGDVIEKDDNIILLESDKASVEVPSSAAGTVTKISVAVGDQVSEGMVLIELDSDTGTDSEDSGNESNDAEADDQQAPENNAASADSVDAENDDKEKAQEDEQASSVSDSAADSAPSSGKATTHALPDLGVDEAQVSEIMVSVGDMVSADQSILLIESDKASVEVPAPEAGKIEKILVEAGDMVANGQDFIVISSSGSEADSANKSANESKTDKQTSSNDQKQAAAEPKQASVKETSTSTPTQSADNKLTETQVNEKLVDVYAGPAVRKLARQLGVDISQVTGSAINERILKEDLFAHVKQSLTNKQAAPASSGTASRASLPSLPDMSNAEIWGETEVQDLSRLQKVSIPQLNYNTYLPQVTQFDLSDITETEKLRGELKGGMKAEGIGFTILAFVVKATAYALTQHPRFNSHLSDDNSQIILRKSVNMGIAVATDDGLIVPVIKNVQDKGLKQIAIEIGELAVKARDKKLSTKDLQGASFTISSQGNLGGTAFTPLVNWPQVGILGVSEASMQPRWNESSQSFEPRLMLPLSLSYDHRVINGADAAVFTRYIATLLADPRRILL